MGVSIKWLKQYVDFDWSPAELAHRLTMAGIAVENIEEIESDTIMEMDLTPNRGDCLGLINLAREVAALSGGSLKIPELSLRENDEDINDYIKVEIDAPDLGPRYMARLVKNVEIKESPLWMQEALLAAGIRPINNVVDVTNYVMLESNQPLHAFDYNLLGADKRILVRRARRQEIFTTLDGVDRELNEDMLVITDGERAVALAGIMGGENTEIKDDTKHVLLESANFLAASIRRTSRRLGLRSDSSVRFEKGADINGVKYAVNRAAQLIQELAGGEVVGGICDVYPMPQPTLRIALRPERVNFLLGIELPVKDIEKYLSSLGLTMEWTEGQFIVEVPSYRPDITMEVDLIEEIARLHGYENIPASLPQGDTTQGGLNNYQYFRNRVKNVMARSLHEVINYSFINPNFADRLLLPVESPLRNIIKLANPLSEDQSVMRTLLLPGLLENITTNLARKNQNLAFFETGAVFYPVNNELPLEKLKLGAAVAGRSQSNWLKKQVDMDFYFLKGILEDLLWELGIRDYCFVEGQEASYHPGRTARLICQGQELGIIGEVHPLVLQNYDIKTRTCTFELDLDELFKQMVGKKMMESITKYPAVERDIALLMAADVTASRVLEVIKASGQELLQDLVVFDIYAGEQVPPGYKSMALKLTFQSAERTLTDAEINECIGKIMQDLQSQIKAVLR
ncbi:MAG: phenylalanine--tRNA ligase subunit beta [Syntrophomonadaceae bacterium]|nr:phenylalanine--tRNA ligase subunit beta [Syntrophomonadaceae bacterium]